MLGLCFVLLFLIMYIYIYIIAGWMKVLSHFNVYSKRLISFDFHC